MKFNGLFELRMHKLCFQYPEILKESIVLLTVLFLRGDEVRLGRNRSAIKKAGMQQRGANMPAKNEKSLLS